MNFRRFFAATTLVLAAGLPMVAAETTAEWISKARSYLGSEAALSSVTSLHFEGAFEGSERVPDPTDATKTIERPVRVGIDIVFQKPMQQRQTLRSDKIERTTTLDNYDGWERVVDKSPKGATRLALLDGASIKRLRATTIENLSFYSDHGAGRRVELEGDATVDGIPCVKISFRHSDNIVFIRYFDRSNGRLVKTDVEGGGEIREEGEMIVSGIRFPKKVINRSARGAVTTITFDRVVVNEAFLPETFAVPSFQK
jgi:hypothetical protein